MISSSFNSVEGFVMSNVGVVWIFRLLTDFACLYNYEFLLSLCKIVRSSVILLLPLFIMHNCKLSLYIYAYWKSMFFILLLFPLCFFNIICAPSNAAVWMFYSWLSSYVPFDVITIRSFPHSRRVPHVEHELLPFRSTWVHPRFLGLNYSV